MTVTTAAPPTGGASETKDRPRKPKRRLYLAWGGGLAEPALIDADRIAEEYEEARRTGKLRRFADLARVKVQGDKIRVFPVVIEPVGSYSDGHATGTYYAILDARTRTQVERFTARIDGRA